MLREIFGAIEFVVLCCAAGWLCSCVAKTSLHQTVFERLFPQEGADEQE